MAKTRISRIKQEKEKEIMSKKNEKKVSNLIQYIGFCRDLLEKKDFKEIYINIKVFEKVTEGVRRSLNKYTANKLNTPDFTVGDLSELSDEIKTYLENNYPIEFSYDAFLKLLKNSYTDGIDDKVFREYTEKLCCYLYVDTKLREAMKITAYCAVLFEIWISNYKNIENNSDVIYQMTEAIQSFLN